MDSDMKTELERKLIYVSNKEGTVIFRASEFVCAIRTDEGPTKIYLKNGPIIDVLESPNLVLEKLCES